MGEPQDDPRPNQEPFALEFTMRLRGSVTAKEKTPSRLAVGLQSQYHFGTHRSTAAVKCGY
jgi:hypothetical protein